MFSAANVSACAATEIEPLIAMGRQAHHPPLSERFADAPEAPENPTPVETMAHRLQTPAGRKLYALRKQTPEPVFGIIKSVMGFRQFLLRGHDAVRGEWSLVTMAWNMKRLFALSPARSGGRHLFFAQDMLIEAQYRPRWRLKAGKSPPEPNPAATSPLFRSQP